MHAGRTQFHAMHNFIALIHDQPQHPDLGMRGLDFQENRPAFAQEIQESRPIQKKLLQPGLELRRRQGYGYTSLHMEGNHAVEQQEM